MKNDIVENFKKLMIDLLIILWESNYELEDPYKGVKKDILSLRSALRITNTEVTPRGQILENRFQELVYIYEIQDYSSCLRSIIKDLDPFDIISIEAKIDLLHTEQCPMKILNTRERKVFTIPNFIYQSFLANTKAKIKAEKESLCSEAMEDYKKGEPISSRMQLEKIAKKYLKKYFEQLSENYREEKHCHLKTILERDWTNFSFLPLAGRISAVFGEVTRDKLIALYRRLYRDNNYVIERKIQRKFFEITLELNKLTNPNMEYRKFMEETIEKMKGKLKEDPDSGSCLFVFTSEDYDKLEQECLGFYDYELSK